MANCHLVWLTLERFYSEKCVLTQCPIPRVSLICKASVCNFDCSILSHRLDFYAKTNNNENVSEIKLRTIDGFELGAVRFIPISMMILNNSITCDVSRQKVFKAVQTFSFFSSSVISAQHKKFRPIQKGEI
jgi:hypothetical protein